MRLSLTPLRCDLADFRKHYAAHQNIEHCEAAVSLYRGPLLAENYYEWSSSWEAWYDIRYMEMLICLAKHYKASGDKLKAAYYQKKLDEHSSGEY